MSLVKETFQGFYPEKSLSTAFSEAAGTFGTAARVATKPAEIVSRRLNQRDTEGKPAGAIAILKDQLIAMVILRKRKRQRSFRRALQSA